VVDGKTAQVLSVAPADNGVGVLWCDYQQNEGEGELTFARLTSDGTAASEPRPVAPCILQYQARLAWNGSGFGAARECRGDLCFARLDESGVLIGEILQIPIEGMIATLYLFWYNDRYGFAWNEFHAALGANRFLAVSNKGVPLLFNWHATGFGLFYIQPEGEETQLAYQEIRCLR